MFTKKKVKNRSQYQQRKTIDTTHQNQLKEFEKKYGNSRANALRKKYDVLKMELNTLTKKKKRDMSDSEIERFFSLQKDLKEMSKTIEDTTTNMNKNEYFLKTGHLLFNYYGEKDKHENKTDSFSKKRHEKSVIDFFGNKNTDDTEQSSKNNANHRPETKQTLQDIIDAYMNEINDSSMQKTMINPHTEYCEACSNHKIFIESESILLCNKCGVQEHILMNQNKPSYKDPPREYTFFAYKRINHFNEWLSQFQAKESTHIPVQIIEDLKNEIKKERIQDISLINTKRIRRFLKKLGYNKYYEHIPHIINKLNGSPPPIIQPEIEEKLRAMFKMIQVPFLKHCPPKRKNFLSYSYVLHKFVQLLNMSELTSCFPLLKSRQKLYQQDMIWKNICKDLNWEFVKSV